MAIKNLSVCLLAGFLFEEDANPVIKHPLLSEHVQARLTYGRQEPQLQKQLTPVDS